MDYNEKMKLGTWSKQTQTNPILLSLMAGKIAPLLRMLFILMGPDSALPERQDQKERFMLTFPENFFNFVDIGSVAQAVEQRTFNA
jgi:hypothetical protein